MKARFVLTICILALASGTSCRTLSQWDLFGRAHRPLSQEEANRLLAKARAYITAGNPDKALRTVEPLLGKTEYAGEVRPILLDISRLRAEAAQVPSEPSEPQEKTATIEKETGTSENDVLVKERQEALREAQRRIRRAETLFGRRQYREAQETLAPLLGSDIAKERVQKLAREINRARIEDAIQQARLRARDRAIQEVESRAIIPDSYGKTVRISRQLEPIELPRGPMEELINRKVDMALTNAGVREMIMALSKVEGLNIIADQALQEDKRLTVNVHGVPLKELLSYIARNMGIAFYVGANTIWVTAAEDSAGGPQLETRIFKLRHGFIPVLQGGGGGGGGSRTRRGQGTSGGNLQNTEDTELEDVLEAFLNDNPPEGAMYRIFHHRNLLVVRNTRENLRVVEELLKEFDQPPMQVLIEARFITISESDLKEIGFDVNSFSKIGSIGSAALRVTDGTVKFKDFPNAATGGNITLSGILGNHTYQAILHLLEEKTSAHTLSAPRVTVVNNHTARIRKCDVLYYFEEYDLESVDVGDEGTRTQLVPSGTPTELDLGITLTVKPSIGNDGRTIQLALRPEITQFIKWLNFQTSGDSGDSGSSSGSTNTNNQQDTDEPFGLVSLPKINENTVETSVVVNSGDTVVLGGMVEDKNNRTVRKVPLLGDIPYIGALFRHTEIESEPVHLLIFVTARTISGSGEFIEYTDGGTTAAPATAR